jgi:hypothetical protein
MKERSEGVSATTGGAEQTLLGQSRLEGLLNRLRYCNELLAALSGTAMDLREDCLVFRSREGAVQSITLRDGLLIGRQTDSPIAIPGDPLLGRQHFRLRQVENGWVLEDLKTKNGTFVNDRPERVAEHTLCDGDFILAGNQIFVFLRGKPPELTV